MRENESSVDELEVVLPFKRTVLLTVTSIIYWAYAFLIVILYIGSLTSSTYNFFPSLNIEFSGYVYQFLLSIVCPIICSLGIVLLFIGKRKGYLLFIAGQLPTIIYTFIWLLSDMKAIGLAVFFTVISNVFPILFLIIFGTQLKEIKNNIERERNKDF